MRLCFFFFFFYSLVLLPVDASGDVPLPPPLPLPPRAPCRCSQSPQRYAVRIGNNPPSTAEQRRVRSQANVNFIHRHLARLARRGNGPDTAYPPPPTLDERGGSTAGPDEWGCEERTGGLDVGRGDGGRGDTGRLVSDGTRGMWTVRFLD